MKRVEVPSYPVSIFIAGEYDRALQHCRDFCDHYGLCVTVTRTHYAYTGGDEAGLIIGLINYPRFPAEADAIFARAEELALSLLDHLRFPPQQSCTVQAPDKTVWFSRRPEDLAIAAGSRRAKTPKAVECEASQSGGEAASPKGGRHDHT
jgi:hypothetical protein